MELTSALPITFLNYAAITGPATYSHGSYAVVYVLSGNITISKSDMKSAYAPGDITLLSPGGPYVLAAEGDNTILHLGIHSYFMEQYLTAYNTLVCDSVLEPNNNYTGIKQIVTGIASRYLEDSTEHALAIYGLLFQFLDLLRKEHCFAVPLDDKIPQKYKPRIRTLIDYIDRHYDEPLTLASLADALFLSPQYLSKFFKKYLHMNFREYLLEKRLFHAYRDICYTDGSITDIAFRHGFLDMTSFGRAFKNRYGETPGKFRKAKQTALLQEEYEGLNRKEGAELPFGNDALLRKVNVVDVNNTVPFSRPFSVLMNIGFAKNLLMEDFLSHLSEARQSLRLKYLRIQGLISSAFIPRVLPDFEYYFLDADRALDYLYQNGFLPFIELSRLSYSTSQFSPTYTETCAIPRNRRFYELLEAFLKHCASDYPQTWVRNWKFELWKTPKESLGQYVTDFIRIKGLIDQYMPGAMLGGPGFDSSDKEERLERMLEEFTTLNVCPDFISASFSLLTRVDDLQYILSTDKDLFPKKARAIRSLVFKYFRSVPFYITEWNSVLIPNAPVQYSCFQAAFICKSALELAAYCDMFGYWIFSDAATLQDPAKPETLSFWGQGLFNKDNIAMPSYYAFQLLNYLGEGLILQEKDCCVTKSGPDHYQIIAFNYSHILPAAAPKAEREISFADIYKLFENTPPQQMRFRLNSLKPGTYRISRFLLDRAHGSILDLWIGGFAVSNIDELEYLMDMKLPVPKQLNYLQRSCIPEERTIYLKVDESLTVDSPLLAHNVCVWDIVRQV